MSEVRPAYVRDTEQSYFQQLWERRDFAWFLAWGNIRSANSHSSIGLVWLVLNPLLLAMIYLIVFGVVLQTSRGNPDYLSYLITGMFVFYYTRQAASAGATSLTKNLRLLSNLAIPKLVMPISSMMQAVVGFGLSIVVAMAINLFYADMYPSWVMLYLIPAFILQTVFNFGLAALFARGAVVLSDITNILPYVLRIWLYLSPIIWPMTFFEEAPRVLQRILEINPIFSITGMYRTALLGYPFEMSHLVAATVWALVIGVLGVWLFTRSEETMLRGVS